MPLSFSAHSEVDVRQPSCRLSSLEQVNLNNLQDLKSSSRSNTSQQQITMLAVAEQAGQHKHMSVKCHLRAFVVHFVAWPELLWCCPQTCISALQDSTPKCLKPPTAMHHRKTTPSWIVQKVPFYNVQLSFDWDLSRLLEHTIINISLNCLWVCSQRGINSGGYCFCRQVWAQKSVPVLWSLHDCVPDHLRSNTWPLLQWRL